MAECEAQTMECNAGWSAPIGSRKRTGQMDPPEGFLKPELLRDAGAAHQGPNLRA